MTDQTITSPFEADSPKAFHTRFIDAPLPRAMLSVLLVIGGHLAIGYGIKAVTGDLTIKGYDILPTVWATGIMSVIVMAWVKMTRGDLSSLGLTRPKSYWKAGLAGAVGAVGLLAALALPLSLLVSMGLLPPVKEGATALLVSGPDLAVTLSLSLAFMWINAAFGEELLFRGFMMNNVHNALGSGWKSGVVAALVVSLLFGAVHVPSQGLYGLVATGIAGLALGVMFLIGKRNLFPVVIAHGVVNSIAIVSEATTGSF